MAYSPTPVSSQPEGKHFRRLWAALIVFGGALVVLLFAAGFSQVGAEDSEATATRVDVKPITLQSGFYMPVTVYGLIESPRQAKVGFERDGLVAEVLVEEGDSVSEGQQIAMLDTQRLQAQREELNAGLARARAESRLASLTVERIQSLVNSQVESAQRLDEAKAQVEAASAQVNEVKAALESLQVESEKSVILAPFAGVVDARMIDAGTVVSAGTPIVSLTSQASLQARFALPADVASAAEPGERVQLKVNGQLLSGEISHRLALRQQATRTIDILVTLPPVSGVMPGDMASMQTGQEHEERGAWVPVTALSNGTRGLWRLFVIETSEGGEPVLEGRTVEVIYTDGERAFVRGAISEGDQFVVSGTHRLAPGQSVSVTTAYDDTAGLK
ncbi:efflux RND transporter periplasmic adaptor subunit [Alteromonas sp. H39]|uniref:efflux RND transporter periplasmic adaptor subunit n=1 Tax=Alteromonas sp. H39 TaxID=3389876 RepID=UPI0039E0B5E5